MIIINEFWAARWLEGRAAVQFYQFNRNPATGKVTQASASPAVLTADEIAAMIETKRRSGVTDHWLFDLFAEDREGNSETQAEWEQYGVSRSNP